VKSPIDFQTIINRLYNKHYNEPREFWAELGLVFRNCRLYHKNPRLGIYKMSECLRSLALYLYDTWYQEQRDRYIM